MRVSIFGLGYVGAVTSACLSRDGFTVVGVDVSEDKVRNMAQGLAPIVEVGLSEQLRDGVAAGRIHATTDATAAVHETDVSFISVGTPSQVDGSPNLQHVWNVCRQIGAAIRSKDGDHVVVLRSTVPPGTTHECAKIIREEAGRFVPVAFNPEFLREGSALKDYDAPPYTVIGTEDAEAERALRALYASVNAAVLSVDVRVAELVKTTCNAWRATKVAFANEIGRIAKGLNVDGRELMEIFLQDTRYNLSAHHLRPGFAYGGSCLPKDTRALGFYARSAGVTAPLLEAVQASNGAHIQHALDLVLRTGARRVAVFGLAFKPGTDDLRESPAVPLVKALLGEGITVRIYDGSVQEARLMGTNLEFIRHTLPHFEELLYPDAEEALEGCDLVVVTHGAAEFRQVLGAHTPRTHILDLAGLFAQAPEGWDFESIVG